MLRTVGIPNRFGWFLIRLETVGILAVATARMNREGGN